MQDWLPSNSNASLHPGLFLCPRSQFNIQLGWSFCAGELQVTGMGVEAEGDKRGSRGPSSWESKFLADLR